MLDAEDYRRALDRATLKLQKAELEARAFADLYHEECLKSARLLNALEAVEWLHADFEMCNLCEHHWEEGHDKGCLVGEALRARRPCDIPSCNCGGTH